MIGAHRPLGTTAGNLRERVEAYITNGRYDPSKSQRVAEDYKNRRETIEIRRQACEKKRSLIFAQFNKLVQDFRVPTNEDHYNSLRRPPETLRHSPYKHRQDLRRPSALLQNNIANGTVQKRAPKPPKKSYGESKLVHPHSKVKPHVSTR